jgi:ACS family hexuronate transporter-like MFS transporter
MPQVEKFPADSRTQPDRACRASRFRWFIAGLLLLATTINYIDRQALALLKPALDRELGWSNQDFGLVNSVFFGVYAASYVFFGAIIDRVGVRAGYAISIVWWSLAAMAHSLAGSVRGFLCARVALGAGEGGNFPACIKASAHWFPSRERALAASLFNSGTNIGPVLAPAIVPWIANALGWRMAFVLIGVAGLLWLALWLPFYKDAPAQSPFVSPAELQTIESDGDDQSDASGGVSWAGLFVMRQTWAIILAKFLTDPVWWFFLIWLPDFFNKTRHLDLKGSWVHLVTIYSISTVFSVAGGWFTGHLMKLGWTATRARKTGMLIFAGCVIPVLFAPRAGNWLAVVLIGFAGAAHQAWSSNIYASISDMFPRRAVAAVAGIGGMAGALGGMLFPVFVGNLLDYFQNVEGNESAGYAIIFGLCSSAYVIAFAINHLLAPRFERANPP